MKYRANALNAILENWSTYENMLQQYADGDGSMAEEAEKTANSLDLINKITDKLGLFGTAGLTIGTILGVKNVGRANYIS